MGHNGDAKERTWYLDVTLHIEHLDVQSSQHDTREGLENRLHHAFDKFRKAVDPPHHNFGITFAVLNGTNILSKVDCIQRSLVA